MRWRKAWIYDRKRDLHDTFLLATESPVMLAATHESVVSILDYFQELEDPRSTVRSQASSRRSDYLCERVNNQ